MPSGDVTPGTTSNAMPASASASSFLAAAPENERIAAFEPDHRQPAPRALDHHAADLFLRERMHRLFLADVNALAIFARQVQQVLVGEMVVEDGVGDGEQLAALPRDQVGIARVRRRPGRPCS